MQGPKLKSPDFVSAYKLRASDVSKRDSRRFPKASTSSLTKFGRPPEPN